VTRLRKCGNPSTVRTDTQIAGIEFAHGTKQDASKISRMAIILPRNIPKEDVPSGTEVWVL
jgi:hypothetical protein